MSRGKKVVKITLIGMGGLAVVAGGVAMWANHASDARLAAVHETHHVSFPVPFPLTKEETAMLRTSLARKRQAAAADERILADAGVAVPDATDAGDNTREVDDEQDEADDPAAPVESGSGKEDEPESAEGTVPADATAASPAPSAPEVDPLQGVDLDKEARKRALTRGKHLVEARYACTECHGADFGGGTMMDGMPVARLFGPNLTKGEGSVVKNYTLADWDRIVRHGVLPDGRPAAMPSLDFFAMSDEELSDIITYIDSLPPVDRPSQPRELGPVGIMLMALGEIKLSAEEHPDHQGTHAERPPRAAATAEFGKHLMNLCFGCHRPELNGGAIVGGDPSWPPAKNITLHEEGIAGWTYEDFVVAMREGKSKDGTALKAPMSQMVPYAKNMKDIELEAMWKYLQTVSPSATGK